MDNKDAPALTDGFSESWLSLREPADHAARSRELDSQLQAWTHSKTGLSVTDLGAGTGSNLRYLCPLLGHQQQWTLIDHDAQLLTHLPRLINTWATANDIAVEVTPESVVLESEFFGATVTWHQHDLSTQLDQLDWVSSDLITASALLDLTSERWLSQLAALCAEHQCASLFVLNYDGTIEWTDTLERDDTVRQLLNAHQLSDKGFGPALGPSAGLRFAELAKADHAVTVQKSDWHIGAAQRSLQQALIDGWAPAAREASGDMTTDAVHKHESISNEALEHWYTQRSLKIQASQSELHVGHNDVLAIPLTANARSQSPGR